MIAKAKWFTTRKYTGWGLTPKTWQGVVYVIVIVAILIIVQSFLTDKALKTGFTIAWTILILADILHARATMKLDEREQKIEAIAERNASWAMVAATSLSIIYVTTIGKSLSGVDLMPVLIFPIIMGVVAKALSNFILQRKGI